MTLRHLLVDVIIQSIGLLAAMGGGIVLLVMAARSGDGGVMTAVTVYGLSLLAMFVCSILNSIASHPPLQAHGLRDHIRALDHAAIYLLIAGTYTPFCLLVIGGTWGFVMLAGIWIAAGLGIASRLIWKRHFEQVRIILYVLMGWSGLAASGVIADHLPLSACLLLVAGGVVYTVGAPVHRLERLPYHSAIWHGCVVAAAALHYSAILLALTGIST